MDNPIVVLGGGIAGMAASLNCGAPVYESHSEAGGVARSSTCDGFTFDYGIHVLQTEHADVLEMFQRMGIRLGQRQRKAMIYSHRTFTAYPFQVNTAGLPLAVRARCLLGYLRRGKWPKLENYEDWIYQNFGRGFGDTFLIPYSEKFWTIHPRDMTHEWTGNRVPPTNLRSVLRGAIVSRQTRIGTNAVFRYPDDGRGFGSIPAGMAREVQTLHLNHRATAIDTERRRVFFNDGESETAYNVLISTIPLPSLVALATDAPEEVVEAAEQLRYNSICVVNLGIDRPDLSDWHWVHFPEPEISFFRISFPANLGKDVVPPGKSSISAEVSYSKDHPCIDRETIVERVRDDLIKVKILKPDDRIVHSSTLDIQYGYVIYDRRRSQCVATIHKWLKSVGIIPTGRYGLWAYLWSHESLLAGQKAASQALNQSAELYDSSSK